MRLFGIADLHLSFTADKPMDIYGGQWVDHVNRVEQKWKTLVEPDDVVLLAGDHSWALKREEAALDLEWIASMPGHKVLIKGNHDLWWSSVTKLNQEYEGLFFLQNNAFQAGDYTICGTRGWICPGDMEFTAHDQKIYERELWRLRLSLKAAKISGATRLVCMIHFPPVNDRQDASGFSQLFEEFGVELVIYGHLHGPESHIKAMQGERNGVEYRLVSCDYLACTPLLLTR